MTKSFTIAATSAILGAGIVTLSTSHVPLPVAQYVQPVTQVVTKASYMAEFPLLGGGVIGEVGLVSYLLMKSKNVDPKISKIVTKHFWDLM